MSKISNTVIHHSGFFTFQRKFVSLFPICPVLQMNYGTSEMSTCQPRLKVRSLWSNALGKGSSKKLWRSPTAEIGWRRTAKIAPAVERIYRFGAPYWSDSKTHVCVSWYWFCLSAFSFLSLTFYRKSMAATRWRVPHVNNTSVGCVWAYSAGLTHTVTLTMQIHPATTSKGLIFVLCWPSRPIIRWTCFSACFRLFHGVDLEAEEAFWSDEEDWRLGVVRFVEMHFISHDHQ